MGRASHSSESGLLESELGGGGGGGSGYRGSRLG